MSQAINCGCVPPRLFGLVDACGNVLSADNPLLVKGDYADGWALIDEVSDDLVYMGFPVLNPDDEDDPLCSILEIRTTLTVTTRKWSGGTTTKEHLWSNRTILEYHFLS